MDQKNLSDLRAEIDRNNRALLELLSERAALVGQVREIKERTGAEMYDPRREREILDALVTANPGPFPDETIRGLFKEILKASLALMRRQGTAQLRVHRKPGALDHARPLEEWELPECFHHLRGRLTEEEQVQGTREYIRVLRLLEKHPIDRVAQAIKKALGLRRCSRDIVAQYLYPGEAFTPPTFSLNGREQLQGVYVAPPDLQGYTVLLGGNN